MRPNATSNAKYKFEPLTFRERLIQISPAINPFTEAFTVKRALWSLARVENYLLLTSTFLPFFLTMHTRVEIVENANVPLEIIAIASQSDRIAFVTSALGDASNGYSRNFMPIDISDACRRGFIYSGTRAAPSYNSTKFKSALLLRTATGLL